MHNLFLKCLLNHILKVPASQGSGKGRNSRWNPRWPPSPPLSIISYISSSRGDRTMILVSRHMFLGQGICWWHVKFESIKILPPFYNGHPIWLPWAPPLTIIYFFFSSRSDRTMILESIPMFFGSKNLFMVSKTLPDQSLKLF